MTAIIGFSTSLHQVSCNSSILSSLQAIITVRQVGNFSFSASIPVCIILALHASLADDNMMLQAMVSCAINGLGLALVIPCVQSLVADYHPSESRGKAFGFMFFTASCGKLLDTSGIAPYVNAQWQSAPYACRSVVPFG